MSAAVSAAVWAPVSVLVVAAVARWLGAAGGRQPLSARTGGRASTGASATRWAGRWRAHRRRRGEPAAVVAALPGALEDVARALRAGSSLAQALAHAAAATPGPLGDDWHGVVRAVHDGMPLGEALGTWARTRQLPAVHLAAAALVLGHATGGELARAADATAATLRERAQAAREVTAQALPARLSAWVVAVAPVGFTAFTATLDPRVARFVFGTPAGLGCLAGGAALTVLGAWWMTALVRKAAQWA